MWYAAPVTTNGPTVGQIVHYVSFGTPGGEYPKACRAAVVTEVDGHDKSFDRWTVGLCVLNPTGQFFNRMTKQDGQWHDGGTWHFPCGV